MSVTPVSPVVAATLPTDLVGSASQSALSAVVEAVALAETATLLELAAPDQPPATPAHATPANPVSQAADTARAAAAARQGSLAPLLANLAQVAGSPALPSALRAAVSQVLALQLPTDEPVTADVLRQAVSQSGLFLEAHVADAPSAPPLDLKAALLVLQRALAATAPETPAASQTTRPASASAPTPQTPQTPQTAQGEAAPPVSSAALKAAVAEVGAVLEARVSALAGAPAPDAKTALAAVQRALAGAAPPEPGAEPAANTAPSRTQSAALPDPVKAAVVRVLAAQLPAAGPLNAATVRLAVAQAGALVEAQLAEGAAPPETAPHELRQALMFLQRAATAPTLDQPDAAPQAPRASVPPPHRQAAPSAQPAARPTLPPDAEPAAIVQHLKSQVGQALARQTLHQLASLPDGAGPSWMFELPLATPQGASVAQFMIDRDGQGGGEGQAPTWRARFSIDIEPLGPVHVHLRMVGESAAVTVWAERPDSLARLRGAGEALARALPAEVTFRGGTPPRQPAPASGRFIDQTS